MAVEVKGVCARTRDSGCTQQDPETCQRNVDQSKTKTERIIGKKALAEFRCKIEDAILGNFILGNVSKSVWMERRAKSRVSVRDISLWGVPLLPSKGHEGTDIVLLKFLKARDFNVPEAFKMLQRTLIWRMEFETDGILDENLGSDLESVVYVDGIDREGHPLCFNVYGAFKDKELYEKTFGSEENCEKFLRWRVQSMEKATGKLSFRAGGVDSIVQITDLKNSPGPGMKELRAVSKNSLLLFQDNYPEFVHRNIMINVPFSNYAFHLVLSRFLTQRTKSKFVFARPSRVAKTLLKFISPEHIPVQYGGLKRENDTEFSPTDGVTELIINPSAVQAIQIPAETGMTVVWDIMGIVIRKEVKYKEEFIPEDECSYNVLLHREKKVGECVRNSFYIGEPGKIVITIENLTYKKKKVFYRFKTKPTVPMYVFFK